MNNDPNAFRLDLPNDRPSRRRRTGVLFVAILGVLGAGLVVLSGGGEAARSLESLAPATSSEGEEPQVASAEETSAPAPDPATAPGLVEPNDTGHGRDPGESQQVEDLPTHDDGAIPFERTPPKEVVEEDPGANSPECDGEDYIHPSHGDWIDPETGQLEAVYLDPATSNCDGPPCCEPPGEDAPQWDSEPINTKPEAVVEVSPEHPVEGDLVTVRIHWSDAEANVVSAQYGCDSDGPNGTRICFDGPMVMRCPTEGVQPLPPPRPGSGTSEFSFTARAGRYDWDRGFLVQSVVADEGSECTPPDPYEDHFAVSGTIDVAPNPDGAASAEVSDTGS